MEELKPCPFCGSQALVIPAPSPTDPRGHWVQCSSCDASSEWSETRDEAARKWNRRNHTAPPTATEET